MAQWNRVKWTEEQDAAIRRVYERGQRGSSKQLAAKWNVAPGRVSARAAFLGLPPLIAEGGRKNYATWLPKEISIVKGMVGQPLLQIRAKLHAAGFRRSIGSITGFVGRCRASGEFPSRLEQIEDSDHLTVADLALGMGVHDQTVLRWISRGMLVARRLGGDGLYRIHRAALRNFLKRYTAHWNHQIADRWFLVDALSYEPTGKIPKDAV